MEILAEIHPRIVHFPVALFILYFFLETGGILLKKDYLSKSAHIILITGIVTAVVAVLTGNQAHEAAKFLYKEKINLLNDLIERHQQNATITVWYFFAVLILRTYLILKKKFENNWKYFFIPLGLAGCYLIYITGIHGGELVFKYGIGTQLFGK
jgi:uncharacterized membrane protein